MDDNKYSELQALMDALNDDMLLYAKGLSTELNITEGCALDVIYLRGRSRWTEELEKELIRLHAEGSPPKMCEFGN